MPHDAGRQCGGRGAEAFCRRDHRFTYPCRDTSRAETDFLHDGITPVTESSAGGTGLLLTGLGVDDFLLRLGPVSTSMFLTDALGSLVATTDTAGGVQSEVTYEPFGATEISSLAPAYRFTGREHDEPLYLHYYRARYYHTDLQRFISEDPLGFYAGDTNLYAYVGNSPTNFIDPLGLVLTEVRVPTRSGWGTVCVDTGIAADLERTVAEALKNGIPLVFNESFRTTKRQEEMYLDWQANPSKYARVGKPNTSHHEAGLALDVSVSTLGSRYNDFETIANSHGFYADVAGDLPHFQIRDIQEYGYSNLTEAIKHNQKMKCSSSKSAR